MIMASPNSFYGIFFYILFSFFNFTATKAQIFPIKFCQEINNKNTTYQTNLHILFNSLTLHASNTIFQKDTVENTFGLFMCRVNKNNSLCYYCVRDTTKILFLDPQCSFSKQGIIYNEDCMVRYSNTSFFSTVTIKPTITECNKANISIHKIIFFNLLSNTIDKTIQEAAKPFASSYAVRHTIVSDTQTLYSVAQCTEDLSPQDCATCLTNITKILKLSCGDKQGGRVLSPSCNFRFELYPFFKSSHDNLNNIKSLPFPETRYEYPFSNPQYSGYISHNCSPNVAILQKDSFLSNESGLATLLTYLTSNATNGNEFQMHVGSLYGLYMCTGFVCGKCVRNASERLQSLSECRLAANGVIWFESCLVRFGNQNFFSRVDTYPRFVKLNVKKEEEWDNSFMTYSTVANKLADMENQTGDSGVRYRNATLKLNDFQTLYIVAQCTRDLSSNDCAACLSDVVNTAIPWRRLASVGGRVLYPSCTLRFELFEFLNNGAATHLSPSSLPSWSSIPQSQGIKRSSQQKTVSGVVSAVIIWVILFSFSCYLVRAKVKNHKTILKENFGDESNSVGPLQFDVAIIKAATNKFSDENKIGKGGFGEVYKGILIDGRHIAVKRLSKTSRQGAQEFRNEVLLIAKLQHRNLVEFIGFCVDEKEKILIYEYVPNKSLDYFLFGNQLEKVFNWSERHNIIGGIVRGILYLHEYSRLKIIHRDLKPSNILLDKNLNPKISDFGLAKIIEIDQQEGSTKRIIGTYGYMSPEYAMFGQFSEKSDIYSFGIMILEIISGRKNIGFYESDGDGDGLLNFVWRQWMDQTPLNILDPKLRGDYSKIEATKYIQIGLLCVQENPDKRPSILSIGSYLNNEAIELPSPEEPAFIVK